MMNSTNQTDKVFNEKLGDFEYILSQLDEFGYKHEAFEFSKTGGSSTITFTFKALAFGASLVLKKMRIECDCEDNTVVVKSYNEDEVLALTYYQDCRLRHSSVNGLVTANIDEKDILNIGSEPKSPQAYIEFRTAQARDKAKSLLIDNGFVNILHGKGAYSLIVYYISVDKTEKYYAAVEAANPGYLRKRLERFANEAVNVNVEKGVSNRVTVNFAASHYRAYVQVVDIPNDCNVEEFTTYMRERGGYNIKVGEVTLSISKVPIADLKVRKQGHQSDLKREPKKKEVVVNITKPAVEKNVGVKKVTQKVVTKPLASAEGLAILVEMFGGEENVTRLLLALSKALPETDPKLAKAMELLNSGAYIVVPEGETFDFALPGGVGTMKIPYTAIKGAIKKADL